MDRLIDVSHSELEAAIFKLSQSLGNKGRMVVGRLNSDTTFVNRVAKRILNECAIQSPLDMISAHKIMDDNFFGPQQAVNFFEAGINSDQNMALLTHVPFSEETLTACKDTHILVAVPSMSILDIRSKTIKMNLHGQKRLFYDNDWYDKEAFALVKDELGWRWHLVRKTPVVNSISKTWDEQQTLLSKDEETPTARVMVYTIIAYFLATGERLFEEVFVRCSDLDSNGLRVDVGEFVIDGLEIESYDGNDPDDCIGMSSARKRDVVL